MIFTKEVHAESQYVQGYPRKTIPNHAATVKLRDKSILLLWENQNIVFRYENHISMIFMSFTFRSNSVCYFSYKYIEQFSKINQKNTEIFANLPSLRLYKILFGEVKNSFIGNILGKMFKKTFLNSTYRKRQTL